MVVLVGHGRWGQVYAAALRDAGALAGVAVSSPESAFSLQNQLSEPCSHDVLALVRQTEAQALAVLSPTPWHATHVRLALDLGLPCLVIKPAAEQADQARTLHAEAEACNVPVFVVHEVLWEAALRVLLDAVADGRLGRLREATILRQGQDQGPDGAPPRPMPETPGENLPWLFETVVHEATVANRLAGRQAPVGVEVRDVFASAALPRLDATWRYPDGFEVAVRYDGNPLLPFAYAVTVTGDSGQVLFRAERGRSTVQWTDGHGQVTRLPVTERASPEALAVRHFLRVVQRLQMPEETLADGARAIDAAVLLVQSAARLAGLVWEKKP